MFRGNNLEIFLLKRIFFRGEKKSPSLHGLDGDGIGISLFSGIFFLAGVKATHPLQEKDSDGVGVNFLLGIFH